MVALREAGVPFRGVDLDPLRSQPAVQDLLALTRALAYPADRIAWFSLMRAPWCGLSLADLTTLGVNSSDQILFDVLEGSLTTGQLSRDGHRRAVRLHEVMRDALRQRGRCSWCRLVEQTWLALGGPAVVDEGGLLNVQTYLGLLERLDSRADGLDMTRLQRLVDERFSVPLRGDGQVDIMGFVKSMFE